jgi:hypothetical protein
MKYLILSVLTLVLAGSVLASGEHGDENCTCDGTEENCTGDCTDCECAVEGTEVVCTVDCGNCEEVTVEGSECGSACEDGTATEVVETTEKTEPVHGCGGCGGCH